MHLIFYFIGTRRRTSKKMSSTSGSLSKSTGFYEIFDTKGKLVKSKLRFGRKKEVCICTFGDLVYAHVHDMSKCFQGGRFDYKQSKFISLTFGELEDLFQNFQHIDRYRKRLTTHLDLVSLYW
jgi:hypothetical protein